MLAAAHAQAGVGCDLAVVAGVVVAARAGAVRARAVVAAVHLGAAARRPAVLSALVSPHEAVLAPAFGAAVAGAALDSADAVASLAGLAL